MKRRRFNPDVCAICGVPFPPPRPPGEPSYADYVPGDCYSYRPGCGCWTCSRCGRQGKRKARRCECGPFRPALSANDGELRRSKGGPPAEEFWIEDCAGACTVEDCGEPADPETGLCEYHEAVARKRRTNMAMAKHQPPPKRIPRCRKCGAKKWAYSNSPGVWLFECPNGCQFCGRCRRFIDYRDKCEHGMPEPRKADDLGPVM